MRTRLALLILFLLLLAGCTGGTVPTPTPVPPPVEPEAPEVEGQDVPEATLSTSEGETQEGAPGTRCWGGLCVDMVGVIVPAETLVVAPDESLTFTLTAGDPSNAHLRVLEWQLSDFDEGEAGQHIVDYDAPVAASGELELSREIEWQAPSEPGEYALALFTAYQQGGDISYGWHIVVE